MVRRALTSRGAVRAAGERGAVRGTALRGDAVAGPGRLGEIGRCIATAARSGNVPMKRGQGVDTEENGHTEKK